MSCYNPKTIILFARARNREDLCLNVCAIYLISMGILQIQFIGMGSIHIGGLINFSFDKIGFLPCSNSQRNLLLKKNNKNTNFQVFPRLGVSWVYLMFYALMCLSSNLCLCCVLVSYVIVTRVKFCLLLFWLICKVLL